MNRQEILDKSLSDDYVKSIDDSKIVMIQKNETTTYTFPTITNDSNFITNYVLMEKNGETNELFIKYDIDLLNGMVIEPSTGEIIPFGRVGGWCTENVDIEVCADCGSTYCDFDIYGSISRTVQEIAPCDSVNGDIPTEQNPEGGGGVGGSDGNTNLPDAFTMPTQQDELDSCENLNRLLSDEFFLEKIYTLSTPEMLEATVEHGYYATDSMPLITNYTFVTGTSPTNTKFPIGKNKYIYGTIHSHPMPFNFNEVKFYAEVFSVKDLDSFIYSMYIRHVNNLPTDIGYSISINMNGEVYAFAVDDIEVLVQAYESQLNPSNTDWVGYLQDYRKFFEISTKNPNENGSYPNNTTENQQKDFLTKINNLNLGVSLYKANDELSEFVKLELDNSNEVSEVNCNN